MRLSLLAGAGALGWLAIGASGASAAEVPADSGLPASVTDAVGSVGSPVASTLSAVSDPLQAVTAEALAAPGSTGTLSLAVPLVPDLAAQVPQLASQPTATVLTPVTSLVDDVVAEVPIVQSVITAGTLTEVAAPILDTVDGTVGGATEPVLEVVAPVVEVIDRVPDVVPGAAIDATVPVLLPEPVVEVLPDVPVVPVPADPATAAVSDATAASGQADSPSGVLVPAPGKGGAVLTAEPASVEQTSEILSDVSADLLPTVVAGAAWIVHSPAELPAAPLVSWGGALASMTTSGTAGPFAALGGAALLVFLVLVGPGRRVTAAGLPEGPTFDPGSSPD